MQVRIVGNDRLSHAGVPVGHPECGNCSRPGRSRICAHCTTALAALTSVPMIVDRVNVPTDRSWAIHGRAAPGVRLSKAEMDALAEAILARAR